MAQNPLQAHHILRHLVIVIAEGLAQRMAADMILDTGLAGNLVDDLIGPLARDGARLVIRPALLALEDVFIAAAACQQAVYIPPGVRVDKDFRLLAGLLRLDLGIILPAQVPHPETANI